MWTRAVVSGVVVAALVGCPFAGSSVGAAPTVAFPSAAGADVLSRPWKAQLQFRAAAVQWAGQPGVDRSTFGGRCSVPSDYVITVTFEGEATHAGRVAGTGSHCTQILWTPAGPGGVAYTDGMGALTASDGSVLYLRWGGGTSGVDPATGEMSFKDQFWFVGGTGRFAVASGGGSEGGTLKDFQAVLAGAPVPMWMDGTIAYVSGRGQR
jgi:hypothetical protein